MNEDAFAFWFDGVLSCVVALIGLCLNVTSIYILCIKTKSNMFNHMLIVLFGIDSVVLFTSILWDMVWNLRIEHKSLLIIIYPYVTYPLNNIAMTASVFMTIAIAHDRYLATKHPIHHCQQTKEESDRQRRLFKYLVPILIASILINIPTCFEYDIIYAPPIVHTYLKNNHMKDKLITQRYINEIENNWSLINTSAELPNFDWKFWRSLKRVPWIYVSENAFKHIFEFDRVYHWASWILTGILPFLLLSFLLFCCKNGAGA